MTEGSLFLVPSVGIFSLCLFVLFKSDVVVFVLSYFILSYCYPSEASLFSKESQKGCGTRGRGGREELEGVERGEP